MESNHFALKDIATIFPAAAQKKAEKFPLRELEETEKGHWVAFADDGPESFDVQVTLEKGAVIQHSCDCGKLDANGFCIHQLALLMQLSTPKNKVAKPVTKRKVKEDPMTVLLNQLDTEDLKGWLKEVLYQQKDLAIAFTNRFGAKPMDYSNEDIQKITDSAVRSIVKNKRKIDQSELKKIVLLWKEVHEPVLAHYLSNIASVEKIDVLSNLYQSVHKWDLLFNIKSTKVDTYKKELFAKTIQPLYDIENDETWQLVISGYFIQGFTIDNPVRTDWLIFLSELIKLETRGKRVDFILENFKRKYTDAGKKEGGTASESLTELVFKTFQHADRVKDCITWLKPISYNNTFNLGLIDMLLQYELNAHAESICRGIIKSNSYGGYSIPFLKRLAVIYKKDPAYRQKLYPVLLEMLPQAGDLEDFLILKEGYFKNQEEEYKKWRTRMVNSLGHEMRSGVHAAHLYFDILYHEGKVTKMLERLRDSYTIEVALKYFDILFRQSKLNFLEEISKVSSGFGHREEDAQFYPALAAKVKEHYSDFEIRNILLKQDGYWKGAFARYYEKNITEK